MFSATSRPDAGNSGEGCECREGQEWILQIATKFQQITADAGVGKYDGHPELVPENLHPFGHVVEACRNFEVSLPKTIDADAVGEYDITEINTANILLPRLYAHTHHWPELANKFTENLITLLRGYIHNLFEMLSRDKMQNLPNTLMDDMLERCETALSHIAQTIEIERHAMTTKKSDLADTLNELRIQHIKADLKPYTEAVNCMDSKGQHCTRNMISVSNLNNLPKNAQVVDNPHATLMAYYEVARKRVIDTIIKTLDYLLLTGVDNPLTIPTPISISVLSEEKKAEVAKQLRLLISGKTFSFPSDTTPDDLAAVCPKPLRKRRKVEGGMTQISTRLAPDNTTTS